MQEVWQGNFSLDCELSGNKYVHMQGMYVQERIRIYFKIDIIDGATAVVNQR